MLINIHEQSSPTSIFKMTGLLSTVSLKLESAVVKEHRRASLCCIIVACVTFQVVWNTGYIIVFPKQMIGYWFLIKGCRLGRILSSQRPRLPSITSLSAFIPSPVFAARETCSKSSRQNVNPKLENCLHV